MLKEEEFKRWTGKRKAAVVLEILSEKTNIVEVSRTYGIPQSEIVEWMESGKRGLENALRAKPVDIKEEYEKEIRELQEAYGQAMLELFRVKRKLRSTSDEEET